MSTPVARPGPIARRTARVAIAIAAARAAAFLAASLAASLVACLTTLAAARPLAAQEGCPPLASARRAPRPTVRVRSLLPSLDAWERATAGADSATRVAEFRRLVLAAHPDVFGPIYPIPDDRALAGYLAWLAPRLPALHRLAPGIARAVAPTTRRLATLLPSLAAAPVEVVIGVGFMSNGQVRLVDGRPVLFLGPDVQTIVPDSVADPAVLVAHELVHVAHARANPAVYALVDSAMRRRPTPLHASLFSEGLATWASGCAVPGRSLAVRLLSPELAREAPAAAARLLPVLAAELESTDQPRYGDWFFVGGRPSDIPPRFAYWAGDRMVAAMAARLTPERMLRLTPDEVLRESRAALEAVRARLAAPAAQRQGSSAVGP